MSWDVYILLCDNDSYYVGISCNLNNRYFSHKNKYNISTKEFKKDKLDYKETYMKRVDAEKRETQLKGWSKAKKKALIKGNIELLKSLSKL